LEEQATLGRGISLLVFPKICLYCLFDVRVTDVDVPSYVGHSVTVELTIAKDEKHRYLSAVDRDSFSSFVV